MSFPSVITFDVYGTLTDWDRALAEAVGEILRSRGRVDADVQLAADALEAESRRRQTLGAFCSYRTILRESLRPALATAGLESTPSDGDLLLQRLGRVSSFPETPSVLAELARQYQLAPISNTDDELIAGTLAGLGPVFETTVTAEQARAYKPNPGLFRFALQKLKIEPTALLHVAQGTFSDLAVCAALGIRAIWVNRKGTSLQDGLEPIAVIPDLSQLPAVVARFSRGD